MPANALNAEIFCPVCGSKDFHKQSQSIEHKLTMSVTFMVSSNSFTCNLCHMVGDFSNANDDTFTNAKNIAVAEFATKAINSLNAMGYTNSALARALGLSPRTLHKWKAGACSNSGLALLKILIEFPFIIEVAANDFDRQYILKTHPNYITKN